MDRKLGDVSILIFLVRFAMAKVSRMPRLLMIIGNQDFQVGCRCKLIGQMGFSLPTKWRYHQHHNVLSKTKTEIDQPGLAHHLGVPLMELEETLQ